ncbi:MAG: YeeE/YedE thiosulfate transporter family protein [Polyangiaceae bacterium]
MLISQGKIAGISGIFGGIFTPNIPDHGYRLWFVLGLLLSGVALYYGYPAAFSTAPELPTWQIAVAGLLVGYGTRLGNGCTSGHGVCGISRGSPRSVAATMTFIATGALTVFLVRTVLAKVAQ